MKANRQAAELRLSRQAPVWSFAADERGVSEAVGYIITFGVSTVILVTSLQTFSVISEQTNTMAVDSALRDIGAQLAFAVEEALRAGATYPDAVFSMTVDVPRDINGQGYHVQMTQTEVWVVARESAAETTEIATGERLNATGRYHLTFITRADAVTLCTETPPTIPDGTCIVNSEEGEITVVFDRPAGFGRGAYFRT